MSATLRTVPFSDLQLSICVITHAIVDAATYIACLACVFRINTNQFLAIRQAFVGKHVCKHVPVTFATALDR